MKNRWKREREREIHLKKFTEKEQKCKSRNKREKV